MADENTINLLDNSLDEASQKYIQEALENWKESVTNQLVEQMEEVKAAKIEELEEENQKYREQLREEYADKMMAGLSDLEGKMKAEVTAKVVKDNPELKILEQIKEIVAPLLNEDYRESTYSDTLAALSEEVESLKREKAISEGKETLNDLLAPYSDRTKRMVSALIKEGTSDEVTENFYNLVENLPELFEAEEDDDEDEGNEDDQQEPGKDDGDNADDDDEGDDDKKKKGKKNKKSDDDDGKDGSDENDAEDDPSLKEESYINEGFEGDDASSKPADNTFKKMLKAYATK
jgi:hypothetical protein